ncbi:MAG: hypothetical protein ACKOC5_00615, partial [Chloroflexota bacterium]
MKNTFVPQFQVRSDVRSGQGGYVNGTWYPDRSGVCGGFNPGPQPQPQPQPIPGPLPGPKGGFVNG